MRKSWIVLVAVAAISVAVMGSPSGAQIPPNDYSVARHTYLQGQYNGVMLSRTARPVILNQPANGCLTRHSGSPVYQTSWIQFGFRRWLEIGTGHQCADLYHYWFWGYGWNDTWTEIGGRTITSDPPNPSATAINRTDQYNWQFVINNELVGTAWWSPGVAGQTAEAGLESWALDALVGAHSYNSLQIKWSGNNAWYPFGGYAPIVTGEMCGSAIGPNTWKAGRETTC